MRRRSCAALPGLAAGLALAAIAALELAPAARAQTADEILCDQIAADPADPDKPADIRGVAAIAPTDIAKAIKFCRIASARSRRATYELGRAYAANQQMADAIAAWRKAADRGSTSAMVELGVLLVSGAGGERDRAKAQELFTRAAEAGNPRGVLNLLALAASGGPPFDPAQARALLARAAQSGSAEAEFQLGVMLASGTGGPQDDVAARAMFEKAAAQNHADALQWMGVFAQAGRGGPQDSAAAKSYYERAAALGSADAKAALKRLSCPYVLKDKSGKVVTNLCL
ncbi:MAG TPA: tetratricopeptide repeat protein [Xanthobacteraceae bacterium]|nr:tetratricopeptide repeat protein [Xanthobacteraceae bacterium]